MTLPKRNHVQINHANWRACIYTEHPNYQQSRMHAIDQRLHEQNIQLPLPSDMHAYAKTVLAPYRIANDIVCISGAPSIDEHGDVIKGLMQSKEKPMWNELKVVVTETMAQIETEQLQIHNSAPSSSIFSENYQQFAAQQATRNALDDAHLPEIM